jgi:SAM-dependent methyltransferase
VPSSPPAELAEWKAAQRAVWGAGSWEQVAQNVLAPIHDDLVAALAPRPGEAWLDIATGTGAVALRAARTGAEVTGLDLGPALLATARRRALEAGLTVRFDVGDAERLPYPDASFDVVSSAHGVVFAGDHAAVARELGRVCRPGGRLGLSYWLPKPELAALMERTGYSRPAGADRPRDWADPRYVRELLGDAFELSFAKGVCHWRAESGEASWRLFSGEDGPAKTGLESLTAPEREALRHDWVAYFERHRRGNGVSVPRPYLIIRGRAPDATAPLGRRLSG